MNSLDRLRWQCRRGCLELDLILRGYLEKEYTRAQDEEKKRFLELLKWEDGELLEVLLGGKQPNAMGFDDLIGKLRQIRATARQA
jgi:antitoxin CptB